MSIVQRVAARFAARATIPPREWAVFDKPGHYINGEVYTFHVNFPVRGYLRADEVADGKRSFEHSLKQMRETQKDYLWAMEHGTSLWEDHVKLYGGEEQARKNVLEDQPARIKRTEHARSIDDLGKVFTPDLGIGFVKGEPLVVGRHVAYVASLRAHVVNQLRMSGNEQDLKNLMRTRATLEDYPDLNTLL